MSVAPYRRCPVAGSQAEFRFVRFAVVRTGVVTIVGLIAAPRQVFRMPLPSVVIARLSLLNACCFPK